MITICSRGLPGLTTLHQLLLRVDRAWHILLLWPWWLLLRAARASSCFDKYYSCVTADAHSVLAGASQCQLLDGCLLHNASLSGQHAPVGGC